jgi:hypothetical protein
MHSLFFCIGQLNYNNRNEKQKIQCELLQKQLPRKKEEITQYAIYVIKINHTTTKKENELT